ncbi:MAG: DNA polymerase IV [Bacteroidota bacterium]|nr:DNA polymerase IV [Bacteroidota bacterium]MDP4248646.1 DNA polymerase IV [Bacteroidota bacterium]
MIAQISNRSIAHFDLDAFFVNVEYLRNAKLRGKPIAVGGQSGRGVITSCSYEARKFGVHSAMPVKLAKRLCPELLIIRGDMDKYIHFSNLVTEIIRSEVPLFEKSSIDEFYIDMSGMDKFFGCVQYVMELRKKIIKESGLGISYALSTNKLISKIATNENKPNGQVEIQPGKEKSFLAPLPVEKMPMIGKQTTTLLRRMGVETISVLSQIPVDMMINLLGKNGIELWRRAQGIDDTPIVPYHEQKSIGTENTFDTDTIDIHFLHKALGRMTERIAFELRSNDKLTGCVTIKIRYSDFQTMTMQSTISYTANDHILIQKAIELFNKLYDRRLLVRLVGVRFTHLVSGSYQINIFEDSREIISLYQAIDSVKKQFGEHLLFRGACI